MVVIAAAALGVGVLLVLLTTEFSWTEVGFAIGTGLIAVAALSIVLEVLLRRRLTEEVLAAVDVREEIVKADIKGFLSGTSDYRDGFAAAI